MQTLLIPSFEKLPDGYIMYAIFGTLGILCSVGYTVIDCMQLLL